MSKPLELTIKGCALAECTRKHHSRGYCKIHYQNLRRNGRPEPLVQQFKGPIRERLARYAEPEGSCLIWTRSLNEDGYGQVRHEGSMRRVHKVAYEVFVGAIPDGLEVDHTCHNRACINVGHLRLTTHKQNAENRAGLRVTNTTGFSGVSRHQSGRFQARVIHGGRRYHLGTFETAEAAAEEARKKRNQLFTHNDIDRTETTEAAPNRAASHIPRRKR